MATPADLLALALQHHQAGRLHEAEQLYRQILAAEPNNSAAHNNLGNALGDLGQLDDAIASYGQALALKPDFSEAHYNLANALKSKGRLDDATAHFRAALRLNPNLADAEFNLGLLLHERGNADEAVACYQRALKANPNLAEAHNCLGVALQRTGSLEQATTRYRRAVELKSDYVEAWHNLGVALHETGNFDESAVCFQRALQINPEFVDSHLNWAVHLLLHGNLDRGWIEYEWRWKTGQLPVPSFLQPPWNGEPLTGKTILLHGEQGLGDTIQFVRYAQLVKDLGATVLVECQRPLTTILKSYAGADAFIPAGNPLPSFDFHAPMLRLPRIFKTTLQTIPARVPYLFADDSLVSEWHGKLSDVPGFRVGINWHGRTGNKEASRRDIPLCDFEAIADVPGVNLISLQHGATRDESAAARLRFPLIDLGDGVDTIHGAFMDTAAVMMNLDLVITSDTSIAHLAGALDIPVWVALPFVPDWRWLLHRSDSPWYPTMRLFRQATLGDWTSVFASIRQALHAETTRRQPRS